MGCLSSVPSEAYRQRNIDKKSNDNHNHHINHHEFEELEGEDAKSIIMQYPILEVEGEDDTDNHKMSEFIKKYKLEKLSTSLYREGITVDFLLSQTESNIKAIAEQLTHSHHDIIQQNKFIYAVTTEKSIKLTVAKSTYDEYQYPEPGESVVEPSVSMNASFSAEFFNKNQAENVHDHDGKIRIFITSENEKLSLPLFVSLSDTTLNVKIAYQQMYKLSILNTSNQTNKFVESQVLSYCGQQLMDNKDLSFYGVVPDSELYLNYYNADNEDHHHHQLNQTKLARNSKVKHKKKRSQSELNPDSNSITIPKAKRNKTYPLHHHHHHHGHHHKRKGKKKYIKQHMNHKMMNIFIQNERNKKCVISFIISCDMKIKRLKQKIQRKWGINHHHQRLNYKNQELKDNECISDYDIKENNTIYLTKQLGLFSILLTIEPHSEFIANKKSITIGVEKYDILRNIKLQIQLFLDVPLMRQRLIYLGQELVDDDATIKALCIKDGGVVYLQCI